MKRIYTGRHRKMLALVVGIAALASIGLVAESALQNCVRRTNLLNASPSPRHSAITESAGKPRKLVSRDLWHSPCPSAGRREALARPPDQPFATTRRIGHHGAS